MLLLLRVLPALALLLAAGGGVRAWADPPAGADTDSTVLRLVRRVEAGEAGPTQPRWLPFPTRGDVRLGFDEPGLGLASMVLRDPDASGDETPGLRVWVPDPINTAFGERVDGSFRLLMLDGARDEVIEVEVASARMASPPRVRGFSTSAWGVTEPQGLAVDPATGEVFVLDTAGRKIVRVVGDLGNSPHVSEIELPRGLAGLRGIAVHPADGHLHLLSPSAQELYELDGAGRFLALRPLSAPGPVDPKLMTFAPSMDRTDDPARSHLFLAYPGPSGKTLVTEWTLSAPIEPTGAPRPSAKARRAKASNESILIQEIAASKFDPPSPDSAGIAYQPRFDSLLMVDSEVNEMKIYEGSNAFELSSAGDVIDTFDTTDFSDEPTGVAINPANGHCFFSDDTGDRVVYEVDPGSDGRCLTGKESVWTFSTRDFGSADPEGVAFGDGKLFLVDGVNRELYTVTLGGNGRLDDGDRVDHCDTARIGIDDPEGIGYDGVSGDLFIVGKSKTQAFQVSTDCKLVRAIDISVTGAERPGGLTIAPSSVNPAFRSLWIADRGIDNDPSPNENDGKIYELSLPGAAPTNTAPRVSAGPDLDITLGDGARLEGSVTDDGLPSGSLTRRWSQQSGPGVATFDDPTQEVTDASFSAAGTYRLRLTGDDGDLESSDDAIVTVDAADGSTVFQTRVAASADDAEESAGGAVDRGSSDLELVFDKSDQTVGVRFRDVDVPRGATILEAYVQFQVDENSSGEASLQVAGEAADHAAPFLQASRDLSFRVRTRASASWKPAPWSSPGAAGPDQRTPDLSSVIQEIVNRNGWSSGNALAILISGSGRRTAESFDGSAAGAPLLHVRYAEDGNTPPPPPPDEGIFEARVATSSDDAEENAGGSVSTKSTDLELVATQSNQTVGIRFGGVEIPAGAAILEAYVQFRVDETGSGAVSLALAGEAADDAAPFQEADRDITSRSLTSASASWSPAAWPTVDVAGEDQRTPDLKSVIQEIVNRPGWSSGNALAILISGSGTRTAESFDGSAAGAPLLHVRYAEDGNTPPPPDEGIFETRVTAGSDDAEEDAQGRVDAGSSDLELISDKGDQTVGIRFRDVRIPRGATIVETYVQFQVDESSSDPTSLTLRGEAADAAAPFQEADRDITSRSLTSASASWSPAAWPTVGVAGEDQRTPDLKSVIQEIVNRPGWSSGNALAILISGSGTRTAESFNGASGGAPVLYVRYRSP